MVTANGGPDRFDRLGPDMFICNTCHNVVVCESSDPVVQTAIFDAHTAFTCTTDPGSVLLADH